MKVGKRIINAVKSVTLLFYGVMVLSFTAQPRSTIENKQISVTINADNILIKNKDESQLKSVNLVFPGSLLEEQGERVRDDLWGVGNRLTVRHDNRQTSLTLYDNNPFVFIETIFVNDSDVPLLFSKTSIATLEVPLKNTSLGLKSLGSGGLFPIGKAQGSFTYSLLADSASRNSFFVGWMTQFQGIGTFEPKVTVTGSGASVYNIKANLEFGHYQVAPGAQRNTDILILGFFDDGREGLELYGNYLAKAYHIKLPEKPEVYCTWYHRNLSGSGASTEKDLKDNAAFAARHLAPFGLNTMQIDDHWQSSMIAGVTYQNQKENAIAQLGGGPIKSFTESNFNFPSGMEYTAANMKKEGFTAGIWFMPFSGDMHNPVFNKNIFATNRETSLPYECKKWSGTCIDATSPDGEIFLRDRFKRIYNWGYRYFKIDGLHTGAPSENIYVNRSYDGKPVFGNAKLYNPEMTFVQCFRRGMSILHEEAPDVFILGCAATQNMHSFASAFGMVHAMRVGPDNDAAGEGNWKNVTKGADFAGNLYFLNNHVWYNDPDPYFVRESNPLNKALWMVSWQAVSGVMGTTSMQYSLLSSERLDLIKRALPTHQLNARPVDILENEKPQIWIAGNDRMNVIGLFNWKEDQPTTIQYSLKRMGLDENKSYELFDFWANKYLGTVKSEIHSILEPASCQVLAARIATSHPQVISTSRHITQGLIDIVAESWNDSSKLLSGSSKVVANDTYELRIVVPDGIKVTNAVCNGQKMGLKTEGKILRASYLPKDTGEVQWLISF